MRVAFAFLPAMLALAVPLAAQESASAPVDRLEELLWHGAVNANTAAAYNVYLRRYPNGAFSDIARETIARLGGTVAPPAASAPPAAAAPVAPPPAPVAPPPVVPPAPVAAVDPSPLFLCRPVFASGAAPLERAGEAELGVYLEATRVNTLERYRRYLDAYPAGVFTAEVRALIETRSARANAFAATPVPGPAAARARRPLAVAPDDYPPAALREGQHGAVGAVWEVADDGCVQACRIDQSSGSAALDTATCRLITVRGRYDPARDSAGKPTSSVASTTVTWTLPQ